MIRIDEGEDPVAVVAPICANGFVAGCCVGAAGFWLITLDSVASVVLGVAEGLPAAGEETPLFPADESVFAGVDEPWSFSSRLLRIYSPVVSKGPVDRHQICNHT